MKGIVYKQIIAVEGSINFPIDMLRYDSCWPASESDSAEISKTFHRFPLPKEELVTIKLKRYTFSKNDLPEKDRWASFLWNVIDTQTELLY